MALNLVWYGIRVLLPTAPTGSIIQLTLNQKLLNYGEQSKCYPIARQGNSETG